MDKWRLEAFSDGVIAIIITITVLEIKVPAGHDFATLVPLIPVFFSYILSFVFVAIYWNNHHHLFQAVHHVNGRVLWANMQLLFWLSLVPFTTGWMGESHFSQLPVILYGIVLLWAAMSYSLIVRRLLAIHECDTPLVRAIGSDIKGKISLVAYILGVISALWISTLVASIFYTAVAIMWLVPDRRIERILSS